jgi:hypothetical protein
MTALGLGHVHAGNVPTISIHCRMAISISQLLPIALFLHALASWLHAVSKDVSFDTSPSSLIMHRFMQLNCTLSYLTR